MSEDVDPDELVVVMLDMAERLRMIAQIHQPEEQYPEFCGTCSQPYPCPTWHWAADAQMRPAGEASAS